MPGKSHFDNVLRVTVIGLLACFISTPVFACSMVACLSDGAEFRSHFFVAVRHDGKPLRGVHILITGEAQLELTTGSDGRANIRDLRPGNYWLRAECLGIGVAYQCFHVSSRSSGRAKRSVKYDWGDDALHVSRVSGSLLDSQPGTGGHPLWNLTHRVKVPIANVRLALQNPLTGVRVSTISDERGMFAFSLIPQGTYVLHMEHGDTGRDFDPTDFLLRVSKKATKDTLTFIRTEPGGGSCGGPSLSLQ